MTERLEHPAWEEMLRELGLFILRKIKCEVWQDINYYVGISEGGSGES